MSDDKISVCILLEGSYPFITGGVSAWVHDLIKNLPEIDFKLFTISPEKDQELRYELPDNIVEHKDVVLTNNRNTIKMKKKDKRRLFGTLVDFHKSMTCGSRFPMEKIIEDYPEGYFPYKDSIREDNAWELLIEANRQHNPLYPFSDYFWAWQSAHYMMFTVIGSPVPEADIYHAVSTGYAGMAALTAKIRHKKPFILTEHGLYHKEREMEIRKTRMIHGYQRDMWTRMYTRLSRLCYDKADMIISLFEENRQKQIDLGAPEDKSIVIPNGIDIERFSVKHVKREGFHVGLVGRVVPIKDIKTFIITAKTVIDRIPEAVFHCIGPTDEDPGYYQDCLLLVKSLKIEDKFIFTGRANVLEYYNFLDVLLLTSVREAQPLVILEAYCGMVPVVATRVGNIPELINFDERFLASSRDAEKLAEGIMYIHDHPGEIEQITEENFKRVKEKYDIKMLHSTYREIYRRTAENEKELPEEVE